MATIELRLPPPGILLGNQMVEGCRDGVFVAGIYPHEDGIRVASKYLDGVEHVLEYPPSVVMHLSKKASV